MPATGWWRFTAWVFAGALTFFAFVTGFSIGLFVLPFAVIAVWLVARGGRIWPEILGLVGGIGVIGIVIAALNHDGSGCKTTEEDGFTTVTCGGIDPTPWLVGGLLLLAVASLLYAFARRRIEKTP
jgi:hypothetical protein